MYQKRDLAEELNKVSLEETDLHLHTYYSDGTQSPRQALEHAKMQGIKLTAITDHDGTCGVKEGLSLADELGLTVISGVEFSTVTDNDIKVHMLGYNIDVDNEKLQSEIKDVMEARRERNKKLLRILNDLGYEITKEDLVMREDQVFIGKPIFARALVKKGYLDDPKKAFCPEILNHPKILALKKRKLPVERAMKLIHGAGGLAVLAHPGKIRNIEKYYANHEEFIKTLLPYGLDGIECYHRDHTVEQTRMLVEVATKLGLLITRGSDYHGPEFEKGGRLLTPEDI